MRGGIVREHFQLSLEVREAEALRHLGEYLIEDESVDWLNELELETLEALVTVLDGANVGSSP